MADIEVSGPDGSTFSFPEGTGGDVIKGALQKHYGAPKAVSPAEPAPTAPSAYRSRLAGVGDVTPGAKEFEKPSPEGGLGSQLVGVAEGLPLGTYSAVAGLPGIRGFLPSGQSVAEKVFSPKNEAERSGIESGLMLGMGPPVLGLAGKVIGPAAETIGKGASALKEMAPAFSVAKAVEKNIAPATSVSAVGEKLEKKISSQLESLLDTRRKEFEGVKDAYFKAGEKAEDAILKDYTKGVQEFYAKNAKNLSPDERALIKRSLERIAERPSSLTDRAAEMVAPGFEAIEKERRYLDDVARGLKVEGADAIPALFAKDLSKKLEGAIQKSVPKEFDRFNEVYKTLSEPINRYNTSLGQSVTKTADEYLPTMAKIDPAKIPDKFFSSRRSINELKAMTGDDKFVQQVAREHVANELEGAETASQIKSYLQKNSDWLQELPELRKEIEKIASRVKGGQRLKTIGTIGGGLALGDAALGKLGKVLGGGN